MKRIATGGVIAAAVISSVLAVPAFADTIILKNGDRITGKIVSAAAGKVVITPDFDKADNITVAQADIATFTSPTPVLIKLVDGTMINQPVQQGAAGQVVIAQGGTLVSQPVPLAKIAEINPSTAWTGTLGVNGSYSHASTSAATLGVSATGTRSTDYDRITASAAYNYGEQSVGGVSSTSANNWAVQGEYDYFLTKPLYVYAETGASADHVNFLSLQLTPSVGTGYDWVNQPDLHFHTEGGISWIYQDYSTSPTTTKDVALRVAYHYDQSWLNKRITLFHDLEVLPSVQQKDLLVQGDLGLRTALTKTMYTQLQLNVNYDNNPAPGARDVTSQLLLGVGMTY